MYFDEDTEDDQKLCRGCGANVNEPYIKCAECASQVILCLHCFARGLEVDNHHNYHSYEVVKDDFTVLDSGWTAGEETRLLDAVSECGIGNWNDICNQVKSKTSKQCELHYNKCFINKPRLPLPVLEENHMTVQETPIIFRPCEDPPRPADGNILQQEMSGYMPARGDFTVEHNNLAEYDIKDIECDHNNTPFFKAVMLAVLDVYRNVLLERQRRKNIIKNYGLINFRKQHMKERKYYQTMGFQKMEKLRGLMKVLSSMEWDMYLESLHYEYELRAHIQDLQEYRSNGLRKLVSAGLYDTLKDSRTEDSLRRPVLEDVCDTIKDDTACRQWIVRESKLGNIVKGVAANLPNLARRLAPPLEITGLPNFEKLHEEEKQLCTSVRIVPDAYIQFKKILLHEQNKTGYVRLASARNLLKIDVNKTRKVFDFLCKEGLICKEHSLSRK